MRPGAVVARLFALGVLVVSVCFVMYESALLHGQVLDAQHEHSLRKQFADLPGIDRFHFVAEQLRECRSFVAKSALAHGFRRWWESSSLYSLATLDSWWLRLAFVGLLVIFGCFSLFLAYQFYTQRYWMDRAMELKLAGRAEPKLPRREVLALEAPRPAPSFRLPLNRAANISAILKQHG